MVSRLSACLLSILVLVCLVAFPVAGAPGTDIRIGVLAFRGGEGAEFTWSATLAQLARALPRYHFEVVPLEPEAFDEAVKEGRVDFVISNPGTYVELEAAFGVSRIATVEFQGGPPPLEAIGTTVFTRSDRADIRSLTDIRHRRLVAVSPELFGGFRVAWREFAERGVNPFSDTASLAFVGFPVEGVFDAVKTGKADIGIARGCSLEELIGEGRIAATDFKVIEGRMPTGLRCQVSGRLYPDWPLAKVPHTPDALAKQVALALLAMPPSDKGQAWTIPVDYQAVEDLFRELKIGPYAGLKQRSFGEILRDNWQWLTMVALAFAWGIVHLVRVQYLVRRRTEELNQAHSVARRQREDMEHAARLSLMGEMASSLAHEISQPLAAIVNYARGCQRRIEDGGRCRDDVATGIDQIVNQAERAAIILRRMRDFVRKRPPAPLVVDVSDILLETLDFFVPLAERRGVTVTCRIADDLPKVEADRIQIEEVLVNLLQNAVDAVEGRPEGRVHLSAVAIDDFIRISVGDNGSGMSEQTRERMFEAFYTTKAEGLGLGLSLSRSIVEAHGGRVWGDNCPTGGAVVSFALPFAK